MSGRNPPSPVADGHAAAAARPRVLVVDDQPMNIRVLHMLLARHCQVIAATGAAQALALCEAQPPDLVMLDVVMPDMDGYELCRQLKARGAMRDVPVIFVSGHDDPAQQARGQAAGGAGFLTKPVDPAQALRMVLAALGQPHD